MSHVVTMKTKLTNEETLNLACERMGIKPLKAQQDGRFAKVQDGREFQLDGWKYPVVVDLKTGELFFDNYNGHWGAQATLDRFVQYYTLETAKHEAQSYGFTFGEELTLDNGVIELELFQNA